MINCSAVELLYMSLLLLSCLRQSVGFDLEKHNTKVWNQEDTNRNGKAGVGMVGELVAKNTVDQVKGVYISTRSNKISARR